MVAVAGDIEDVIIGDINKATESTSAEDTSPSLPVNPIAKFLDLEGVVGDTGTEKQTVKNTTKSIRRLSKFVVFWMLLSAPLLTILWAFVSRRGDRMAFPVVADDDTTWAEATYQLQSESFSKPRLKYDGNNGIPEGVFPLGLCRGDCDTDDECGDGLICYQRNKGSSTVPGCQGDANLIGSGSDDFCIRLSDLEFVGNNGNPPEAFPLQKCQSDCDNNAECAGDLICYQRDNGNTVVPGCNGDANKIGSGDEDFCIDPIYVKEVSIASKPTNKPTKAPTWKPPSGFDEAVVLKSGKYLSRNQFVFSPSKRYKVGLSSSGNFKMFKLFGNGTVADTVFSANSQGGHRLYMQTDGNLLVRNATGSALWRSETYDNDGAKLVVDDGGQIAVIHPEKYRVWIDGVPREYNVPSRQSLKYPLRGIFYYPWYPETWTVNGKYAHFEPTMGFYSSSSPDVIENHIDSLDYAHIDVSIASWWGPETNLDRARLLTLMDTSLIMGTNIQWTIYYEEEYDDRPSPSKIRKDLKYLKKWFASHPAWAHIDGKPLIFVWNKSDCDVTRRWNEASNGEWYVVTKLFRGFEECSAQPDHWHQYGISDGTLQYKDISFTIGPGFWLADKINPRRPRIGKDAFCANAKEMVESKEPWQLIVSFNEAGEGTMIESSPSWASDTPYGYYLDCLHNYH